MTTKGIITGVVVVIALIIVGYFFFFSSVNTTNPLNSASRADGLVIQDVVVGSGAEAIAGATVAVHYVGTLQTGEQFDSSLERGTPIQFTLGSGQVIAGWEQGIKGMKVGGRRVLVIPPTLGYGDRAVGPIPANSTLIFQVELVDVKNP